ncbi:unnamed protein product [Timema podura]|uniref:Uncharacterized protein n=1 Tax=Timema podura TaxID=61482 RepID=A0ABN7P5V3_TIMPD|nr:unnamed protein product [Timema podura]
MEIASTHSVSVRILNHVTMTTNEKIRDYVKLNSSKENCLEQVASRRKEFFSEKIRKQQRVPLPDGWVVPATIQRASYRDTRFFGKLMDIRPHRRSKPDDNLRPGEKLRTLVKVQTGDTEYQGEIGRVGRLIISERLCGEFPKRRHGTNLWDLARHQEEELLHHVHD